ncbi:hypothetical protein WJX73_002863 [Symbiochloris irregularis]|uniref:Uncharacterized protein n=1 Tax=Symbiochloris irregularis TaxID=706552 RepID=A0AAW1NRL9_9CHLO
MGLTALILSVREGLDSWHDFMEARFAKRAGGPLSPREYCKACRAATGSTFAPISNHPFAQFDRRNFGPGYGLAAFSSHAASVARSPLGSPTRPAGRSLSIFGGGCPSGDKDPNFYANVGSAIRTLRDEIPTLFYKDLTYDIYRPDIVFRDPRNRFTGIKDYKTIFWSLRFHGQLFFKPIFVDIKRLWQPDERELRLRWTVVGKPRVPWEAQGTFDGVSMFKLDKHGKIYEHQVDNVIFRDPPVQSPLLTGLQLLQGLTGQQTQRPVPGMCRMHDLSQADSEQLCVSTCRVPDAPHRHLLQ